MKTLLSPESQQSNLDRLSGDIANLSSEPKMAKCYQADQQVKYLHLQAEIEVLIQQLQSLKHQNS